MELAMRTLRSQLSCHHGASRREAIQSAITFTFNRLGKAEFWDPWSAVAIVAKLPDPLTT